jgi:hypothetical protein
VAVGSRLVDAIGIAWKNGELVSSDQLDGGSFEAISYPNFGAEVISSRAAQFEEIFRMFTAAKHQSYLSDYKGYRLEATCACCRRRKAYSTDYIREKIGDCQLDGLKTAIGTVWGCDRVYNVNADQCGLRVEITGKINKTPDIIRKRDDKLRSKRKSS